MTSVLKVDNIQNSSGTSALSIDSNGVVSLSVLPAFRIGLDAAQSVTTTATQTVIWNDDDTSTQFIQGGFTLNKTTGVITVPYDGVYQFNYRLRLDNAASGYIHAYMSVNGNTTGNADSYSITNAGAQYQQLDASDVLLLTANDTVKVEFNSSVDTSYSLSNDGCMFSAVRLG